MTETSLSVKRWAAWMPGVTTREDWAAWAAGDREVEPGEGPDVKQIPPMLRRRLSPLGKMAVSVAWPLLDPEQAVPSIFCSRHGELERTVGMLRNLAQAEPLSPTHFSLSVHNAIGGVYSIARKDSSAITALAVGDEGLSQGLLETHLILSEGRSPEALCVIYDAPMPDIYQGEGLGPHMPYAAAFVVGPPGGEGIDLRLALSAQDSAGAPDETAEPHALRFIRLLLAPSARELRLPGTRHDWDWSRLDDRAGE